MEPPPRRCAPAGTVGCGRRVQPRWPHAGATTAIARARALAAAAAVYRRCPLRARALAAAAAIRRGSCPCPGRPFASRARLPALHLEIAHVQRLWRFHDARARTCPPMPAYCGCRLPRLDADTLRHATSYGASTGGARRPAHANEGGAPGAPRRGATQTRRDATRPATRYDAFTTRPHMLNPSLRGLYDAIRLFYDATRRDATRRDATRDAARDALRRIYDAALYVKSFFTGGLRRDTTRLRRGWFPPEFSEIERNFWKISRNFPNFPRILEVFRRFPRILRDFREFPKLSDDFRGFLVPEPRRAS